MKRLTLACAAAAACLVAVPTAVAAASATPDTLKLDSSHDWSRHYTPPVSSASKLANDTYYVATVTGTFSYYAAINYTEPQRPWNVVCGAPAPSSQNPGSLGGDGPVGFDAEFVFARPWTVKKCANAHLPVHWGNFQMNDGSGWSHPNLLGALPTSPRANHTYTYAVVGHNKRAQFRLVDVMTRDNYGVVDITLRPAAASDCSSYASFGFGSQAKCTTALAPPRA